MSYSRSYIETRPSNVPNRRFPSNSAVNGVAPAERRSRTPSVGIRASAPSPAPQSAISGLRFESRRSARSRAQPNETLGSPRHPIDSSPRRRRSKPLPPSYFTKREKEWFFYRQTLEEFHEQGRQFLRELEQEKRAVEVRRLSEGLHVPHELQRERKGLEAQRSTRLQSRRPNVDSRDSQSVHHCSQCQG
jgi:hypothetical protein